MALRSSTDIGFDAPLRQYLSIPFLSCMTASCLICVGSSLSKKASCERGQLAGYKMKLEGGVIFRT